MNRIIDNFRNFINVLIFLGCIILPDEDEEYEVTTAKYIPDVLLRAQSDRERGNNEENSAVVTE